MGALQTHSRQRVSLEDHLQEPSASSYCSKYEPKKYKYTFRFKELFMNDCPVVSDTGVLGATHEKIKREP